MTRRRWPRELTAGVALLVWVTLGLRLYLSVAEAPAQNPWLAALDSFSYFTLLTTLLVALALSAPLLPRALRPFNRPDCNTLIAASSLLVAMVYTLMLRHLWDPQGLRKVVDVLLHDVIPLLFIAYWWLALPKHSLRWRQLPLWLLYPLGYLLAILGRGLATGSYPYPFIDVGQLGYLRVALNALGLLLFFTAIGGGLVALGRWQVRVENRQRGLPS